MINSVRLENFKNFRDATLNLGPFTVIVGTNASGKSNLRDAFRFLHGMSRGYSLADILGQKTSDGAIVWNGVRGGGNELIRFGTDECRLTTTWSSRLESPPYNHRISLRPNGLLHFLRVGKEEFFVELARNFAGCEVFDAFSASETDGLIVHFQSINDEPGKVTEEQLRSSKPVITQLLERDVLARGSNVLAQVFINQMRQIRFLDLSPEAMRNPSMPGQQLGDKGENLSSVLLSICQDQTRKHAMMEWIRQLTPIDVVDFEFPADQAGRVLVALKEANGQVTSAYSASDGTLRFLALIAALMAPDATQFYFLEEIDTGIHPARLHLLVQLIEQFTSRGEVQVVATTHSPQMLAMLNKQSRDDAYLVYRHEHEPDAQLMRIIDIPSASDILQNHNLGRLLETGWMENTMSAVTADAGDP